jgi:bifunctional N-acetylglutamate synthase/kinase
MLTTRKIIVELLGQLSGNREARDYLQRFSGIDNNHFAVIKVGGAVMDEELEELASALAFLRHVGLFPIVLHGAGPQLNRALDEAGIEARFVDNLRYTDADVLKVARPVVYAQSQQLAEALERLDVRARMIQHGVFECDYLDESRYGLVGTVTKVHVQSIEAAIQAGALPIVGCFGESAGGQVLNVNADWAANALIKSIRPYKIVFLTSTGGLLDESGNIISAINLVSDYEKLEKAEWVHSGMSVKLEQVKSLLDDLPLSASVSITSARHLTKELFTHRGAGTLIRRGETIEVQSAIDNAERHELSGLLEECFGRRLKPRYFEQLALDSLLWTSSHRAAAIVSRDANGIAYMDKFAVTPSAQGEGLGLAVWHQVTKTFPQLYWRARANNPINAWYFKQADACLRKGNWLVYGIGFDDMNSLDQAARRAVAMPESWMAEGVCDEC